VPAATAVRLAVTEHALGAYVIAAEFLAGRPAFALGDGTVRLDQGGTLATVRTHPTALLAAALAQDGGTLYAGGDDGRLVAVHPDGTTEDRASVGRIWIDQVAAGPNGAIGFAGGRNAWVIRPDGTLKTFAHPRSVGGVAFAPKGLRLAVARYDGATLWWAGTEAPAQQLEWKGMHAGITWSPDGKYLVTAMQENALHGWRVADGRHMRMTGYPAKVRSLSWSPKGRFLASAGANAAVLWPFHFKDGPMGRPPLELGYRDVLATRVACHPEDDVVAIGYIDGAIDAARIEDAAVVRLREPDGAPLSALAWDADGGRLVFGGEGGAAGVIDLAG
jgi:WD40 repeat protein